MKNTIKVILAVIFIFLFLNKSNAQLIATPLNITVSETCGEKIIIQASYPYTIPTTYRLEVYLYIERTTPSATTIINQQLIGTLTNSITFVSYTYILTGYWGQEYCVKVKQRIIYIPTNTINWATVFSETKCITPTLCNPNGIPGPPSLVLPPPTATASGATCSAFKVNWYSSCPAQVANIEIRNFNTNALFANINVNWGLLQYTFTNLIPGTTYSYKVRVFYNCTNSVSAQGWTPFSNPQTITLPNTPPVAGANKTIPSCSTSVQLAATAVNGGYWSVLSSSPSGCSGTFSPNINTANAIFTPSGACSTYVLKWQNGCGSSTMTVSQAFVCGMDLTDSRDSKVYPTVLINGKCWFKNNLNYGTQISWAGGKPAVYNASTNDAPWPATNTNIKKYCLNNNTANCTAYGGLYLGDVAALSELCPPCWHVSTDDEWTSLANFAALGGNATTRLKGNTLGFNALKTNSSVTGTNPDGFLTTGFVTPVYIYLNTQGYALQGNGVNYFSPITNPVQSANWNGAFDYHSAGKVAMYWTSTYVGPISYGLYSNRYGSTSAGEAWYRRFAEAFSVPSQYTDYTYREIVPRREFALHVRCVKN